MSIIALMPWWGGVLLGAIAYVVLHRVAQMPLPTGATQPGQMGSMMTQTLIRSLALAGQYVVPVLCFAGAGVSAWQRKQRQDLVGTVAGNPSAQALNGMTWSQFEQLVGESFRMQGYGVVETGTAGPDGGIDLVLSKGSEKFLVQCKQWRATKVGVTIVRELYGVMAARGAAGGFVVTSGAFTADAIAFAEGRNIQLIAGPDLHQLIRKAVMTGSAPSRTRVERLPQTDGGGQPSSSAFVAAPDCPICSKVMTRRVAKRGANAGQEFWGCTGYPACRGTRR